MTMSLTKTCINGMIQLDKEHVVPDLPKPSSLLYHLRTLHLFTASDLKTFVLPELIFGLSPTLSAPLTLFPPTLQPLILSNILIHRLPLTLLYLYLNTLLFTLSNQRLPSSITEDTINKPHRPIPSGRITPTQTTRLLLLLIPLTVLTTHYLGGMQETLLLLVLTWMYNDLDGANENYLIRNLINSFAHAAYSCGSARVASGAENLNARGYIWLAIVGCVIFSTLQVQDLKDQEGDRARGRSTVPLVWGDEGARWSVAVPVMAWSVLCPLFWGAGVWGWVLVGVLGGGVVGRLWLRRGREEDRLTWKVWSVWMMGVYVLPVLGEGGGSAASASAGRMVGCWWGGVDCF